MIRKRLVSVVVSATAAVGLMAGPAAADPVVGGGLVAVNVSGNDIDVLNDLNVELLNDNQIAVPIGIAANVCNVNAAVLGQANQDGGAECTAENATDSRQFRNFVTR